MKEDIDIWERVIFVSLIVFEIFFFNCRCYINISDRMVQKIICTETIIYKWSSFSILLILHLTVLANLYFKDIGSTQTLIFSPNTAFLHCSQQSLHHVYFIQFSLISVRLPHFEIFKSPCSRCLWSNYHHISLFKHQKRPIDYVEIKYMSRRSFVFTKNCFPIVLSEQ